METYGRFLFEFLEQFVSGFRSVFQGLIEGFHRTFNILEYRSIIMHYQQDFSAPEWILVAIAIMALVSVIGIVIALIVLFLKKTARIRKKLKDQEELLDQIDTLNNQVELLVDEKMKLMDMINPELGINPANLSNRNGQPALATAGATEEKAEEDTEVTDSMDSRFSKLTEIDLAYANYKQKDYKGSFTLPEFCHDFRHFAASKLKLYYSEKMIRLFVSAVASTKLVILQGISGTGKTSI